MKTVWFYALVLSAGIALAGCGAEEPKAIDFGATELPSGAYPFNQAYGKLSCIDGAVIFETMGVKYGINGTAKNKGYPAPDPIWRPDPNIPGAKMNLGPVIEKGLALCRK